MSLMKDGKYKTHATLLNPRNPWIVISLIIAENLLQHLGQFVLGIVHLAGFRICVEDSEVSWILSLRDYLF